MGTYIALASAAALGYLAGALAGSLIGSARAMSARSASTLAVDGVWGRA